MYRHGTGTGPGTGYTPAQRETHAARHTHARGRAQAQFAAHLAYAHAMASRCAVHVPADPAELTGPPMLPPTDLIPWGPSHVSALHHSHRWQFSPVNRSQDGWAAAIRASQFGNCSRLLLVEDDLTKAGLGFTAKIWQAALLIALRDNRVLLEVRMVKQNQTAGRGEGPEVVRRRQAYFERPRWCDREPYTLQCLYQPWTHCRPPPATATLVRPGGRPLNTKKWPHDEPYVITGLGRIHRQGMFWHGARSDASREAGRFLFRPRPWVTALADCVMRDSNLAPREFVSLHIRYSVEKQAEGQRLGVQLPGLDAYGVLSNALADDLGKRKVFVQTASPIALNQFSAFCSQHNIEVSYTNNSRSENDAWGGWNAGAEMEQAAVAAINAHIGSQALISVSPSLSLWTNFMYLSFGPDGQTPLKASMCCEGEGSACKKMRGGSRSFELHASPALRSNPLSSTTKKCKIAQAATVTAWGSSEA